MNNGLDLDLNNSPNLFSIQEPAYINYSSGAILIDTCVVINLYGDENYPKINVNSDNKTELANFIEKAVENKAVFIYSPENIIELLISHSRGQNTKSDPHAMEKAIKEVERIEHTLDNSNNFYNIEELESSSTTNLDNVKQIMIEHNLEYGDAKLFGICQQYGIKDLLTVDGDFMNVCDNKFQIYTTSDNFNKIINRYQLHNQLENKEHNKDSALITSSSDVDEDQIY